MLEACALDDPAPSFVAVVVTPVAFPLELAVNVAVVTVMLLFPVAVALAVPPVPTTPVPAAPGSVVKPAATSKEMISGTIDATLPPRPIT